MPLPLGPVPDIMPPMEDPNFRKSRKRKKSRGADNSALKQTETGEVDAVGLDTATLAGRASRKKRKRQSRSELVTGAGEPEPLGGRGDADSLTLSNSETMVTLSEHKRKHKHKHKRKHGHDFSLSLESEAGSTHQLARHRHRHRRHHQESSSATETHIRPEPDAQTARKHRHKHRHKHKHKHRHEKPSQSSTVDNSQEDPDGRGGHQHRHKQREATHHAEPAPDRRMGSTLQVEGVEELSERQLARFHESEDQYHSLHSQWFRSTQENRERLREKIGKWKGGRWSVQEIRTLQRNVRAFLKEYGVASLSSLIFTDRSQRHAVLYRYMAKDINRPLLNIYKKMLRVFDVEHFVGRWTPEMEQKLLSLHRLYGNCWKTIGQIMGMSNAAAINKYRMLRRKRRGPWTREEEQRLVEAMEHFHAQQEGDGVLDIEDLPETIRWEDVAERVGSRTHHQCRQKWVLYLCWKQKGGHDRWTSQDDLKLIRTLVLQDEEDEEGVDWGQLCGRWPSARSASHLRGKWASLRRDVPNYRIRTFQDNLEWLLEHKVPALERQQKALETELIEAPEESD